MLHRFIEEGKQCFNQGKYDLALQAFTRARELDPASAEANFELGKTHYLLKNYPLSLDYLKTACATEQFTVPARVMAAKIYKETGRHADAMKELRPLLGKKENLPEVTLEFAETLVPFLDDIKRRNNAGSYTEVLEEARAIYPALSSGDAFFGNRLLSEIEIAEKRTVLESKPRNLIVTLTTNCNLKCVMCEWVRAGHWEIPEKTMREVIEAMPYLERVVWQGGEVFLSKHLPMLVDEAGKHPHLQQVITTNGLLVDEKWAETLLRHNVDLTFSVDGATREVYEKIRQGADYDLLLKNLKNFNRLKEQVQSRVKTNLHIVVMRSNYRQLEDYLDFAADNGFKYIAFLAIGGNYDNPENIFHNRETEALDYLRDALPRIREKAAKYGILLENRLPVPEGPVIPVKSEPLNARGEQSGAEHPRAEHSRVEHPCGEQPRAERRMICHLPWIQMYIDYDGSIRPDCVCRREIFLGNVAGTSLKDAWNNAAMQEYRRRVAAGEAAAICNRDCTECRVSERYLKFS